MTELQVNPLIDITLVIFLHDPGTAQVDLTNPYFLQVGSSLSPSLLVSQPWLCSALPSLLETSEAFRVKNTIMWTTFIVSVENKPSTYLSAQMERTKTKIPAGEQNQLLKPAEGARDGDFSAKRPSQRERWSRGVHGHSAWWSSRQIFIGLRLQNRTTGPVVSVDSPTLLDPVWTQRCNCCYTFQFLPCCWLCLVHKCLFFPKQGFKVCIVFY